MPGLSKSRFLSGTQCLKKLWWEVHEPQASELVPDAAQQAIFDRGHRVGELAQQYIPGGVLIEGSRFEKAQRVEATAEALRAGASVIYEAAFQEDGVFVAVDILERDENDFVLSEVKSTLDVKSPHIADVAIQMHVLQRAGLPIARGEVMHLNRDCRHPDLSNLFTRTDVTELAQALLPAIPNQVRLQLAVIERPMPEVLPGDHCTKPYGCPFTGRCWPKLPEHHVSTLFGIRDKKLQQLIDAGYETLADLPEDFPANDKWKRQIAGQRTGSVVVEPGLKQALQRLLIEEGPIAFLDFETIMPVVPVWPGCHPYQQIPVQFSCHVLSETGITHHQCLADGPDDPRDAFAQALVAACQGATTIIAYNAPFEQRCINTVGAGRVPPLQSALQSIHDRIVDLLPIVRDHIYHPGFNGSFSLKAVLPALVPDLDYSDLDIQDGGTAMALLEDLLLRGQQFAPEARSDLRSKLIKYCERDTLAMVRLYQRLCELAGH